MRAAHQILEAVIGFNGFLILALEDGRIAEHQDEPDEYDIISFNQTWSSTALGFGGIGGQAFTPAQTTVFTDYSHAIVFIGGRFAYHIKHPNEDFWKDVHNHKVVEIDKAVARYEK
jgi:hypothetical protein